MKKLLNKIKKIFKKEQVSVETDYDTLFNSVIKSALKSPYDDVKEFANAQNQQYQSITKTEEKLRKDIEYYEKKKKEGIEFLDTKLEYIDSNIEKYTNIKHEYVEKQEQIKNESLHTFVETYSTRKLTDKIKRYGFEISIKELSFYTLVIIVVPTLVAYISKLQLKYIIMVAAISMILSPALTYVYFKQKLHERRYEIVIDYLTNILPIFMQKAKISYALQEIKPLVKYQMQSVVNDATRYIEENIDDPNAERTALELIEAEFPNSRIKAVHDLMESIEFKNSTNYKEVCENMFVDIDAWIKRINTFSLDLKDRKRKMIFISLITIAMNCMFVYLYTGNEYFAGFTESPLYQISTMVFIIMVMLVCVLSLSKMSGSWLINDETQVNENEIKKAYEIWEGGKKQLTKAELITSALIFAVSAYFITVPNYVVAMSFTAVGVMLLTTKSRRYSSAFKKLKRHFEVEFPSWLRKITLSLHTKTVLNSIEDSQYSCSYPMYRELDKFMQEANDNPSSIKPYAEMMTAFDLKEAQLSMKVLYSIQQYGQGEIKNQINSLVTRNQVMLDKAEGIKNANRLAGTDALGYLPMVVFTGTMIVDMVLLFSHVMSFINDVPMF